MTTSGAAAWRPATTGTTRAISSSTGTSGTPVMPDWPPTSIDRARPAPTSSRASRDTGLGGAVLAAVRERVGRGVDDAHERRRREIERAAAHGQGRRDGHRDQRRAARPPGVTAGGPARTDRHGPAGRVQVAAWGRRRSRERRPSGPWAGAAARARPAGRAASPAAAARANVRTSGGRPGRTSVAGFSQRTPARSSAVCSTRERLRAELVEVAVAVHAGCRGRPGPCPARRRPRRRR